MTALDLEAIRQLARENSDEGMVNVDGGVRLLPKDAIAMNNALLALCDEVEQRRAENAKLREVAERVKADCPPFPEIEYLYDAEEVPTGELLCGSCAQCLDEHDADCLYALADLALRGGGG